jgi:hypothetical protein
MSTPTAAAPTQALQVRDGGAIQEAGGVEYNLDNWPTNQYNRLVPVQTLRMPSDLVVPIVQVVQLDPADAQGKSADHYSSRDVPQGHRALTARGLNKLATTASVSFYDERRFDDGTDPDVIGVTVMASMMLPTGQRITAPGGQLINVKTWFGSETSAAEKAKFRKQFYAHVSTRARSRAVRALLSLRASYPEADIAKPFAVVSYAPNMNHPAVRERMLDAMAPAVSALYGPEAAKQVGPGSTEITVHEIPADDQTDGRDLGEGRTVDVATGEVKEEPEWFDGATAVAPTLQDRLASGAKVSKLKGPATAEQRQALKEALEGTGKGSAQAITAALWDFTNTPDITAAQAEAILAAVEALGLDAFRESWLALAAEVAA